MIAKLKVSFVIAAPELGDFIHQYADKVEGLDIVAVHGVAWNKNKPRDGLTQADRRVRGKQDRAGILALLEAAPLKIKEIAAKLPDVPKHVLSARLNRMKNLDRTITQGEDRRYTLSAATRATPKAVGQNFRIGKEGETAARKATALKKKAQAKLKNGAAHTTQPTEG